MSKRNSTKSEPGVTVPAPQPALEGRGERGEGRGNTGSARTSTLTPYTSNSAKGKPTAVPAHSAPANESSDQSDAAALAELTEALDIGSDAESDSAADETPAAPNDPAEGQDFTGEESADAEAAGDNDRVETDPQGSESSEDNSDSDPNPDPDAEPETPAADDEDTDHLSDAELEATAKAKGWPESFKRRIMKERRRNRRLEERLDELESIREENERLKTQATDAPQANAVPVTTVEQTLAAKMAKLEETLEFIESNPDGAQVGDRTWTPAELRAAKRQTERTLRDVEDELREHKRQRTQVSERVQNVIAERHPWMKDRKNPDAASVESLIRKYPVLQSIPEARLWLADGVAFQRLLNRFAASQGAAHGGNGKNGTNGHAANGNGAKPAPPPPRPARGPGKPAATPMAVNGQRANLRAVEDRFNEDGNSEDGKKLLESFLED